VTGKAGKIPPKTIRGNWEPLGTIEEIERGLAILERRGRQRTRDYLLKGMVLRPNERVQLQAA
jgi:hypothetical protein